MFKKYRLNKAISRLIEDKLYEMALEEVEAGHYRKGSWARAMSCSDGIEAKAKSIYLQFRVESMKDEAELIESVIEKVTKRNNASPIKTVYKAHTKVDSKQIVRAEKDANKLKTLPDKISNFGSNNIAGYVLVSEAAKFFDKKESHIISLIIAEKIRGEYEQGSWYVHPDEIPNNSK